MLKNLSRLEHIIGNRVYHLTCDIDAPLSEVKDALFNFMKFVGQIEDKVREAREEVENKANEQKVEEPQPEAPKD